MKAVVIGGCGHIIYLTNCRNSLCETVQNWGLKTRNGAEKKRNSKELEWGRKKE